MAMGTSTISSSSQPPWCAKTDVVTPSRLALRGGDCYFWNTVDASGVDRYAPISRRCDALCPMGDQVLDRDKVQQVIEVIRPAIQADAGDIFLRDVDVETGVVSVELVGACVSCPASTVTLKAGIERILKDRVPGVTEVVDVGAPTETSVGIGL